MILYEGAQIRYSLIYCNPDTSDYLHGGKASLPTKLHSHCPSLCCGTVAEQKKYANIAEWRRIDRIYRQPLRYRSPTSTHICLLGIHVARIYSDLAHD